MVVRVSHEEKADAFGAATARDNPHFEKLLLEARFALNGEAPPEGYSLQYSATKWKSEVEEIAERYKKACGEHKASKADILDAQNALAAELAGLTSLDAATKNEILQDFTQSAAGKTPAELVALRTSLSQRAIVEDACKANEKAETDARTAEAAHRAAEARLWGEVHALNEAIERDFDALDPFTTPEQKRQLEAAKKAREDAEREKARIDNDPSATEEQKRAAAQNLLNAQRAENETRQRVVDRVKEANPNNPAVQEAVKPAEQHIHEMRRTLGSLETANRQRSDPYGPASASAGSAHSDTTQNAGGTFRSFENPTQHSRSNNTYTSPSASAGSSSNNSTQRAEATFHGFENPTPPSSISTPAEKVAASSTPPATFGGFNTSEVPPPAATPNSGRPQRSPISHG
jgi:hypothetical protein